MNRAEKAFDRNRTIFPSLDNKDIFLLPLRCDFRLDDCCGGGDVGGISRVAPPSSLLRGASGAVTAVIVCVEAGSAPFAPCRSSLNRCSPSSVKSVKRAAILMPVFF